MRLVERLAVDITAALAACLLFALLCPTVARGTETLQRPAPELGEVGAVRLDMIGVGGRAGPTTTSAQDAEGMVE
jgi:hypothetical protein